MNKEISASELEELEQLAARHLWVHTRDIRELRQEGAIRIMVSAKGVTTTDARGQVFYDPMAGLETVAVGYGRHEIAEAAYKQLLEMPTTDTFRNQSVPQIRLAAQLANIMPGSLNRVFFVSGGSEANEAALKIIWQYHELRGHKRKRKIIARRDSYHGSSLGPVAVVGPSRGSLAYTPSVKPLPAWGKQVEPPNPYRCRFCRKSGKCTLACAEEVEHRIQKEGTDTVAAMILDPISAAHGVPPAGYIAAVADICRRNGVLLWFDEVITSFGRTGKWFAAEHWGIVPDIMTVSKGITSGYIPLGAAVVTDAIAEEFGGSPERVLRHGHTYGGHPVACAAALANLEIIEREKLVENAEKLGPYFLEGVRSLMRHPVVGHVSGIGLFAITELVENRSSRRPLYRGHPVLRRIMTTMRKYGLVGSPYLLTPPLCITRSEIDTIIVRLDQTLAEVER